MKYEGDTIASVSKALAQYTSQWSVTIRTFLTPITPTHATSQWRAAQMAPDQDIEKGLP